MLVGIYVTNYPTGVEEGKTLQIICSTLEIIEIIQAMVIILY
jgi:hypothetical protein